LTSAPPGKAIAIFLNSVLTLCPAFADVSMDMTPSSLARLSRSSGVTCLHISRDQARRDVPLVIQVRLVPDQHDDHVLSALVPDVIHPFCRVRE
jgi:hypothetical protein